MIKKFNKNGYLFLKKDLRNNLQFFKIAKEIHKKIDKEIILIKNKNLRGSIMGNLNVYPGKYGKKIFLLLKKNKIIEEVEKILGKKISSYDISYGGNLALAGKGQQSFHTDGEFKKKMFLLSISTENITNNNGPTEVCVGTHKKDTPYWKFFLMKKKIKKITLQTGEIVIRTHSLWHRGTKNNSNKYRFLLSFIITPKIKNHLKKVQTKEDLKIDHNFFENTTSGMIKEIIYSKLRLIHFILRLCKSIIS